MKKKLLSMLLVGVTAMSMLAGCGGSSEEPKKEDTKTEAKDDKEEKKELDVVNVAYMPNYASLWVVTTAKEKGYFEEQGIEVKMTKFDDGPTEIAAMESGSMDVAYIGPGAHTLAIQGNVDVFCFQQLGDADCVMGLKSHGVNSLEDLKGKKVAVTSLGSANYFQLQAAMESAGLTIDDVQVEIVGTGAILTALTEGQVDAIVFSKLRTIELNNSGYAASEITCDQFLPSFGNVLVAGDALVEKDPETVDGFCRALNKAIEYIIDGHVEEAVDMSIEKYAPTFAEKRDVVVQILNDVFVKTLWQSDYTKENGIGASNPEKWQALIDESKEIGNIDETFDAAELLYTPAK